MHHTRTCETIAETTMHAIRCNQYWGPPDTLSVDSLPDLHPVHGEVVIDVEGGRRQLPRRADHPEQVSVEAAAAVLARLGAGRHRARGRRGRHARSSPATQVVAYHGARAPSPAGQALASERRACRCRPASTSTWPPPSRSTYGTSHHAVVDRAALKAGETMLVLGAAGGVGLRGHRDRQGARRAGDRGGVEPTRKLAVCSRARRRRADQLHARRTCASASRRSTDGEGRT